MWQQLLGQIKEGDRKGLARAISFVENEQPGYEQLMAALETGSDARIIGITGPPGAGKSTLVDGLIDGMIAAGKKVAVLCVDPSSPFHLGALLGDRIRMSRWYLHPQVFIRSLATRGTMGGLHPKIIEIADLVKASGFNEVIVETVGVGQSEIEIAGLADTTVVVVVPEAGDEVQTMKAGLMEIADIFVVNKADRPGADAFVGNLRLMLAPAFSGHSQEVPIIKTIAQEGKGLDELYDAINHHRRASAFSEKKRWLLLERSYQLIQKEKMKGVDRRELERAIAAQESKDHFNLYQFVQGYLKSKGQ
jgi:LAO/AO transport system kinase